jgi:hypothetical protein
MRYKAKKLLLCAAVAGLAWFGGCAAEEEVETGSGGGGMALFPLRLLFRLISMCIMRVMTLITA